MNTDADDDGSSAALFGRRCRKCGSCSLSRPDRRVVRLSLSSPALPLRRHTSPSPGFRNFSTEERGASHESLCRRGSPPPRPPRSNSLLLNSPLPRFLTQVVRGSERELRCRRGLSTLSLSSQFRLIDGRLAHSFSSAPPVPRCTSPNCADNADSPPSADADTQADRLLRSRKFPAPVQPTSTSEKCSVDLTARMERTEGGQKGRAAGRSLARPATVSLVSADLAKAFLRVD